jgi:predicted enzyme related to lactoylglutathione lyase
LVGAGGRVIAEIREHHVVMADPEGNEFCVSPEDDRGARRTPG